METINASDFKTHCLAILDRVAKTGEPLLVLKRGRPVAKLIPAADGERSLQDELAGTAQEVGDIVAPALPASDWTVLASSGSKKKRGSR